MDVYEEYEDVAVLVPTKHCFFSIVVESDKENLINHECISSLFAS